MVEGARLPRPAPVRRRLVAGSAWPASAARCGRCTRSRCTRPWATHVMVLIFIVIIIGGLGFGRRLLRRGAAGGAGDDLVVGFLAPKLALGSSIRLMVLVLHGAPRGLYPVAQRCMLGGPACSRATGRAAACWPLVLVLIALGLALRPSSSRAPVVNVAAKVAVFILWRRATTCCSATPASSSFAHTMFFGIGGYGIAIATLRLEARWGGSPSVRSARWRCLRRCCRWRSACFACGSRRSSSP